MVILVVLELLGYFVLLRGFRGFFIQTKHNIKKKKQFYLTQKIQQNMIFFFNMKEKLMIVIIKKKKKLMIVVVVLGLGAHYLCIYWA